MAETITEGCARLGLRMTPQRRIIASVLETSRDHPDAEALHARATAQDPRISLATVYRTLRLFEDNGLLDKLEFPGERARYEDARRAHHDHLIDIETGKVIEFVDGEIEALQKKIAARLGYELTGHRLELYGTPAKTADD